MDTIDLQRLYNKAWLFASHAHLGQTMKGSAMPYSTHVAMVANELVFADREESVGAMEIALPAALMHDVIEDTSFKQEDIAEAFGEQIASTVASLSKNLIIPFSEESYLDAIAAHSKEAASIKLCDRITNLQSVPAVWDHAKRESYLVESAQILKTLGRKHAYLADRLSKTMVRYESLI